MQRFKRTYRRRRTVRRRRRTYGKRSRIMRPGRVPRTTKILTITRHGDITDGYNLIKSVSSTNGGGFSATPDGWILATGSVGSSNVNYYAYAINFSINMLPNYTEFTTMWDRYRIIDAKVVFVPFSTTTVNGPDSSSFNQPLSVIHHRLIDRDDSQTFATDNAGLQQMRQYKTYRFNNFYRKDRTVMRVRYPSCAMPIVTNTSISPTPAYTVSRPQWVDANNVDVVHYGIKGMFEVFAPQSNINFFIWLRPEVQLTVQLKDPR